MNVEHPNCMPNCVQVESHVQPLVKVEPFPTGTVLRKPCHQPSHQSRRKKKKTKEKKNRRVQSCAGNFVNVFCAWGCGVSYKSLPKQTNQKAWAKALRKLNAHESQRCPCNPTATRVSSKAKAKKKAAVDDLIHDWETVLLGNHIEILQQQIRFLKTLPGGGGSTSASIAQQITLLKGSVAHTKEFIATINADTQAREASKLKAAKLAADERSRLLEKSSRQLTEAEGAEAGVHHVWTEPSYQAKEQWLADLGDVIEMEEEERTLREHQDNSNAVGVFWTTPTEPSELERTRQHAHVKVVEEKERALRMQDPANPYDEAVGVFWMDKCIDGDLQKFERYANTMRIEEAERARRVAAEGAVLHRFTERFRQAERTKAIWPEFTKALRQRYPDRTVQGQPLSKFKPRTMVMPAPLNQIPTKRSRDGSYGICGNARRRVCLSHDYMDVPTLPASLFLTNLEDIEPLDLDDDGSISPPSSFTDNDDFLQALEDLLTPTPDTPMILG